MSPKRKKTREKFLLVAEGTGHYYITSANPKNQASGNMRSMSCMKYDPESRQKREFKYKKLPSHSK